MHERKLKVTAKHKNNYLFSDFIETLKTEVNDTTKKIYTLF